MKLREICSHIFESKISRAADAWLQKYTYENDDKWPSTAVLKDLLETFPYEGGVIYRGLNFSTAAQWEKFKEETNNLTTLTTGSISSWSPDKKETYAFAISRPTYFLDIGLMQAEKTKTSSHDYMIGHIGVILKTRVPAGVGIDVRKTSYAKEAEVILKPGTYQISVDDTHIPFNRSISKETAKAEFMTIKHLDGDNFDSKKFSHIMFHYSDFDNEQRRHLYTLISGTLKNINYTVKIEKDFDPTSGNVFTTAEQRINISINWNIPHTLLVYYAMLLAADQERIDKLIITTLKKLNTEVEDKIKSTKLQPSQRFNFNIDPSILIAIKMEKFEPYITFTKSIKSLVANRFNSINSIENVKLINKITDPYAQDVAIDAFAQSLIQTLSQLKK